MTLFPLLQQQCRNAPANAPAIARKRQRFAFPGARRHTHPSMKRDSFPNCRALCVCVYMCACLLLACKTHTHTNAHTSAHSTLSGVFDSGQTSPTPSNRPTDNTLHACGPIPPLTRRGNWERVAFFDFDPQPDVPTGVNPMAQCAFEILVLNVSAIRTSYRS